jgi:hypothetical protein
MEIPADMLQGAPSADGKRCLLLAPETQGAVPFTVVLHGHADLKK